MSYSQQHRNIFIDIKSQFILCSDIMFNVLPFICTSVDYKLTTDKSQQLNRC